MKWLLDMDEDIRTGFLLGSFLVTLIVFILINPWLMFVSFLFPVLWIYTLIKTGKETQHKENKTDV